VDGGVRRSADDEGGHVEVAPGRGGFQWPIGQHVFQDKSLEGGIAA
jgi:hypothetical protein